MTEVKALGLLNLSTHPLAKVSIVYAALSFLILVTNKFCKVFKIELLVLAPKVPQYILDCYKPVKVTVEVEERLADTSPVVCELHLYQIFQILQLVLDARLTIVVISCSHFALLFHFIFLVFVVGLIIILYLKVLREEAPLEGVNIHFEGIPFEEVVAHDVVQHVLH